MAGEVQHAHDARADDQSMETNPPQGPAGEHFYSEWEETYDSFASMSLQENLLKGIYAYGLEKPSAIQQKGIVPFTKGHDVIQQAWSRRGRIITFCVGILNNLDYSTPCCQALVLALDRGWAEQIEKMMVALGAYLLVKCHACVDGTRVQEDSRILAAGVHVVVGTPPRVYDMLQGGFLRADNIKMFVVDEFDEAEAMLSTGVQDYIYNIFQLLPPKLQVGVFTANFSPEVLESSRKFMNKPVCFRVKYDECEGIKHFYVNVLEEQFKLSTWLDLCEALSITQSIIFANTRSQMDRFVNESLDHGHAVIAMHQDMDQNTRDVIIREFRSGSARVLITMDPLADVDVQPLAPLVVNYDLPITPEKYMQRIESSGLFGRKGVAINLVTEVDGLYLQDIQKYCNIVIKELTPEAIPNLLSST